MEGRNTERQEILTPVARGETCVLLQFDLVQYDHLEEGGPSAGALGFEVDRRGRE
jgi:hypothetical protein